MKKIELSFKKLELVKGCPTETESYNDINGNGLEDDDFNGDGVVDELDEEYWNGYQDGYEDGIEGDYDEWDYEGDDFDGGLDMY